jgi:HTH-type transcriptional regulator/antitoxin HipB
MRRIHSPRDLGVLLRDARVKQNKQQSQVSHLTGLRQATLSGIENNPDNVRLQTMFKVLSALGYDLYVKPKAESLGALKTGWKEEW